MAVFYGVTVLGEPLTASALGGLVLILAGVALGSGPARLRRKDRAEISADERAERVAALDVASFPTD
jgi:hypothetical protein